MPPRRELLKTGRATQSGGLCNLSRTQLSPDQEYSDCEHTAELQRTPPPTLSNGSTQFSIEQLLLLGFFKAVFFCPAGDKAFPKLVRTPSQHLQLATLLPQLLSHMTLSSTKALHVVCSVT